MAYKIANVTDLQNGRVVWDGIVNAAPEAWLWTTSAMHDFRMSVLEAANRLVCDLSFVVMQDGVPCGLAPLVLSRENAGDPVASYGNIPLPWPTVVAGAGDRSAVENILLDEMEQRIRAAGGGMMSLMLAPPGVGAELADQFRKTVRARSFVDNSFASHWVEVSPTTLNEIRERYRRYVKKFWDHYELSILEGHNIPNGLATDYMDLHVKDSGGVFRPLATYERQVELARRGEAFWVGAWNKSRQKIVGLLLVGLHKGAAYDSSVAVDPEYQQDPVSNLLKWRAIQHLTQLNVSHYELGQAAVTPTYLQQPSAKNYGISFFKEGWTRGRLKTIWVAEKYYNSMCLHAVWEKKRRALESYFQIPAL